MMLLHVHKDKTDEIDLNVIAEQFINVNERRRNNVCSHSVWYEYVPPKLKHLPAPML